MNERKNGTKNERSYGRCEGILFLAIRLDLGQLIAGMGLPKMLQRSTLAPAVLLVQQGCGFQRILLDDPDLLFPSLLEWW
jgi:hypothetical protein